ncbi:MAG: DUF4261 domain-containing protein [Vicinamibacterales bacterium]
MDRLIAMVALRSADPIDWPRIADAFGVDRSALALDPEGTPPAAATLPIPGGVLGFMHTTAPIPWDDVEWSVRAAWHWPAAESELRAHQSHVVVFAESDALSAVDLNLQVVGGVASVIATRPDAAAVFNPHASIVIEPARYAAEARNASREALPILLWLGLHLVSDSVGLSGYTTGMDVFGLLNLEVHDTQWNPPDLLNLLASIAHYEIGTGTQIGAGQNVGLSEHQRVEIQHQPSRYGDGAVSCHLILGLRAF